MQGILSRIQTMINQKLPFRFFRVLIIMSSFFFNTFTKCSLSF